MTTKLKAIIMDGDGSTITADHKLPDNLRDLIIANPQTKWIMATGRSLDLLSHLPIIDYLSKDVPHILDGGSRLMNVDGTSIIDFIISSDELECFFAQLNPAKIDFLYYSLDHNNSFLYSQNLDHWGKLAVFEKVNKCDNLAEYRVTTKKSPPTKIFMRVNEFFELKNVTWHNNDQNIDFTAHGVNKGSTCCKLLELLNLSANEVAFVFNDRNDLPLVEHPELQQITKIMVGDYLPEIKADYHVDTPYDVAEVLAKLI